MVSRAKNFLREYRLIIGRPEKTNNFVIPNSLADPRFIVRGTNGVSTSNSVSRAPQQLSIFKKNLGEFLYYDTIPAQYTEIKGLQIKASIAQSKQTGNPCMIEIYNLDQDTINNIKKDDLLILKAGYRTVAGDFIETTAGVGRLDLPDLFIGQVVQVRTEFPAEDSITHILCGEALTPKRNSKISKSYPANTTRLQVLNDLLDLLKTQGVPTGKVLLPSVGTIEREAVDAPLKMGYVAKGMLFNEIDRLCKSVNLRNFTALGKMYIEPISETRNTNLVQTESSRTTRFAESTLVINIGPDQVKGSVQPMETTTGAMSNAGGNAKKPGLKLTTWLNGNISVDLVVRLKGFKQVNNINSALDAVDGEYRIISVVHKLDYRSEDTWDTEVSLEAL